MNFERAPRPYRLSADAITDRTTERLQFSEPKQAVQQPLAEQHDTPLVADRLQKAHQPLETPKAVVAPQPLQMEIKQPIPMSAERSAALQERMQHIEKYRRLIRNQQELQHGLEQLRWWEVLKKNSIQQELQRVTRAMESYVNNHPYLRAITTPYEPDLRTAQGREQERSILQTNLIRADHSHNQQEQVNKIVATHRADLSQELKQRVGEVSTVSPDDVYQGLLERYRAHLKQKPRIDWLGRWDKTKQDLELQLEQARRLKRQSAGASDLAAK